MEKAFDHQPSTKNHQPSPGQAWWFDGAALGLEAHFKRRPVLVLDIRPDDTLLVAPLSSKRRHGQEQAVTHAGGVSFLTGQAIEVPAAALLSPLGSWEGFPVWRETQQQAAATASRITAWLTRLKRWFPI